MKKKHLFWILASIGGLLLAADLIFTVFSVVKIVVFLSGGAAKMNGYIIFSAIFIIINAAVLLAAAGYFAFRTLKARKE